MAISLPEHEFTDPYGGRDDLAARALRTPGTPEDSFGDDPLRMLRAARFAAQLAVHRGAGGGRGDDRDGRRPGPDHAPSASGTSSSSCCCGADPVTGLRLLVDTGLAEVFLPELPGLRLAIDEHAQHKDVYEHTLTVVRNAIGLEERRAGLRAADGRADA